MIKTHFKTKINVKGNFLFSLSKLVTSFLYSCEKLIFVVGFIREGLLGGLWPVEEKMRVKGNICIKKQHISKIITAGILSQKYHLEKRNVELEVLKYSRAPVFCKFDIFILIFLKEKMPLKYLNKTYF